MAGEALMGLGTLNQGKSDKYAGEYNAQVAQQNAAYTLQQSAEEERRSRVLSGKAIGDIRANYGASGVTSDGSVLDVLEESAANAELDALTIRAEGRAKYAGYLNEADMSLYSGKNKYNAAKVTAAGYLVSGGEKAVTMAAGGV